MPLHLTKIAFRSESPQTLRAWLESHAAENGGVGEARLTTRYLPKRHEEIAGAHAQRGHGSLFWIHSRALIGRSPIIGFGEAPGGKVWIRLEPRLIAVRSVPKRAHQGWRYLEDKDAPPDLGDGDEGADMMPPHVLADLMKLGLV